MTEMENMMKAVGFTQSLPISDDAALQDCMLPEPDLDSFDLLVEIKAIAVNPIDIKTRLTGSYPDGRLRILGFDAAGIVKSCGAAVTGFKTGDEVFYAGSINRQGSYATLQAVDSRLVALKPKNIDFTQAAAMPLTALTAFEMLFDRLDIRKAVPNEQQVLLLNGGAGGVASMAIQLARKLSDVIVVATASRQKSQEWVKKMGAHHVIDHTRPFASQLETLGLAAPSFIFTTAHSDDYLQQFADIIAPQGRLGLIDSPKSFDINPFKAKSVSIHWESMFTRSLYQTPDMARQGDSLNHIAELVNNGALVTTANEVMSPFCAATLRQAHQKIESGTAIGKIVIEGF